MLRHFLLLISIHIGELDDLFQYQPTKVEWILTISSLSTFLLLFIATKAVYEGSIPPVFCLMDEEMTKVPSGRYYGSDCKRSPLDTYRGPGDPVYNGPDGP